VLARAKRRGCGERAFLLDEPDYGIQALPGLQIAHDEGQGVAVAGPSLTSRA